MSRESGSLSGSGQGHLFAAPALPDGFLYREDFISAADEAVLIEQLAKLPLEESRYRQWTAKRRTVSFGGHYDFTHHQLHPAEPIPGFLHPLRARLAQWAGVDAEEFTHSSIAEYRPGTQLGWHRDVPDFELVVGASLHGVARMRFRPYPPDRGWARSAFAVDLQPRSGYIIRDAARWHWQHAISPTKELRYSVTFRTLRLLHR
jgi:alkylated DNA repair dioxygenase AlkB